MVVETDDARRLVLDGTRDGGLCFLLDLHEKEKRNFETVGKPVIGRGGCSCGSPAFACETPGVVLMSRLLMPEDDGCEKRFASCIRLNA